MYSFILFCRFSLLYLAKLQIEVLTVTGNEVRVGIVRVLTLISTKKQISSSELLDFVEPYKDFF